MKVQFVNFFINVISHVVCRWAIAYVVPLNTVTAIGIDAETVDVTAAPNLTAAVRDGNISYSLSLPGNKVAVRHQTTIGKALQAANGGLVKHRFSLLQPAKSYLPSITVLSANGRELLKISGPVVMTSKTGVNYIDNRCVSA